LDAELLCGRQFELLAMAAAANPGFNGVKAATHREF
jgi:hypothetical protein